MKTYNHLFGQVTSFDNLWLAAQHARKGKRFQSNVSRFDFQLEANLFGLRKELQDRSYHPGPYRSFLIHEPKQRMISAAPYRDRVVHHALMNVTAPLFERSFIYDSYANRTGKGSHAAILRYQHYARRYRYVLKCDIRKFFPSIDHEILKQILGQKIHCSDTRWLSDLILDNSNPQEAHIVYFPGDDLFTPSQRRRGLPIGNLSSQWWGNIYLNGLDHFLKETLRVPGYIRFVDDFVLFGADREVLRKWKTEIDEYLAGLRLILHPHKTQVYSVEKGVPFLGFKVYPHYRTVLKPSTRRYRRFLRQKLSRLRTGGLSPEQLESGLNSWLGHIRWGQSQRLEHQIFSYIREQGVNLVQHPSGSWRVLEQYSNQLPLFLSQQEQSHQSEQ